MRTCAGYGARTRVARTKRRRSRARGAGEAKAFASIDTMVKDPSIDAVWICGPNHERVANMEAIVGALENGGELIGIACEKPLARNLAEAKKMRELVKRAGVLDGYLENQVFQPSVTKGKALLWSRGASAAGRPYLARSAEEHSGPHAKWFWQGELQGGGVLNDMMCHSIEASRYLLTDTRCGRPRGRARHVEPSSQETLTCRDTDPQS